MSQQPTGQRSGSHFAQFVIIACLLCASSFNAIPLPAAPPSFGLSNQSSHLQPLSHLSKRAFNSFGAAKAGEALQAAHTAGTAKDAASALKATETAEDVGKASAVGTSGFTPFKFEHTTSLPGGADHAGDNLKELKPLPPRPAHPDGAPGAHPGDDDQFFDPAEGFEEHPEHDLTATDHTDKVKPEHGLTKTNSIEAPGSTLDYVPTKDGRFTRIDKGKEIAAGQPKPLDLPKADPTGASTQKPNEAFSPPPSPHTKPAPNQPKLEGQLSLETHPERGPNPPTLNEIGRSASAPSPVPRPSTEELRPPTPLKNVEQGPNHLGGSPNPELATAQPGKLDEVPQSWSGKFTQQYQKFISKFKGKPTAPPGEAKVTDLSSTASLSPKTTGQSLDHSPVPTNGVPHTGPETLPPKALKETDAAKKSKIREFFTISHKQLHPPMGPKEPPPMGPFEPPEYPSLMQRIRNLRAEFNRKTPKLTPEEMAKRNSETFDMKPDRPKHVPVKETLRRFYAEVTRKPPPVAPEVLAKSTSAASEVKPESAQEATGLWNRFFKNKVPDRAPNNDKSKVQKLGARRFFTKEFWSNTRLWKKILSLKKTPAPKNAEAVADASALTASEKKVLIASSPTPPTPPTPPAPAPAT
ncbi:hypothetical protein MJO28_004208 [Puccinia striiformis f. sp. tritici]|uniref:Uncharacterized protein n=1 Tax=Puccinia striiformis f. sp. tritici TaxID=168172 RepID=A0ACC0EQE8_9BASI|nr:hypothetical protein MJO28_004208 [Puccinia striiformis f. sp. tritici]KAI7963661.1 hypothetical protein MJO29_004088 [Puccinia striiformis f. sp. tritici]